MLRWGDEWTSWVTAYGPGGDPAPIPVDTLLVGGARGGERMPVPSDLQRLVVPRPTPMPSYVWTGDTIPTVTTFEVDHYDRRILRRCWSAAPVYVWVKTGLPDDRATALYEEWC